MIELVLKKINALRLPSQSMIEFVLRIINALRLISDLYDRACSSNN